MYNIEVVSLENDIGVLGQSSIGGFWVVKDEKFNSLADKKRSKLLCKSMIV